jgi:AraC-like DNA-binding protein
LRSNRTNPRAEGDAMRDDEISKDVRKLMEAIEQREGRLVIGDLVVKLVEGFRRDYFPGLTVVDAFAMMLIIVKMVHANNAGRTPTVSDIARSAGCPRRTVARRLADLEIVGAVQRRGTGYALTPIYFNTPDMLFGFYRRSEIVRHTPEKLAKTGNKRRAEH